MKNLFALLILSGVLTFGNSFVSFAQDEGTDTNEATMGESDTLFTDTAALEAQPEEQPEEAAVEEEMFIEEQQPQEEPNFHQMIKEKFIEGGPGFMSIVLLCLILGLGIAIERIITLNLATTDTDKLLEEVESALQSGGMQAAKDICSGTKGPVASIFTQGLLRISEGIDMVEKSIISYGSVEMAKLEKGLVWISLFISLAPMLGFMGTVIGMIQAFDAIEAAGDISPSLVAGGIKVALLTTVGGLIVAVILQLFYNYCVSKIDAIVNQMEDASISLVDMLFKFKIKG